MHSRTSHLKILHPLVCVILALLVPLSAAAQEDPSVNEEIDEISPAVVLIITLYNGEPIAAGSGTIVSQGGTIFTNKHVVEGGTDYAIYMLDDMNELPELRYFASFQSAFEYHDFAILQIDRSEFGNIVLPSQLDLPHMDPFDDIANASSVARGETIYVLGYPGIAEGYFAMTTGSITTIQNGDVGSERMPVWMQTDAEIAPGNSGGLVLNSNGIPLGIPTSVLAEGVTGGRLGGILPYETIVRMMEVGESNVSPSESFAVSSPTNALPDISMDCGNGDQISNGAVITMLGMRQGFTYKATVVGVNGFDPILFVGNPDIFLCNADTPGLDYSAVLPSTGEVVAASTDAQLEFSQNSNPLADVSLVIGGEGGTGGEFLLILEGMAVTEADNFGDPFSMLMTESLVGSGEMLNVYMIANDEALDPLIELTDRDLYTVLDEHGYGIFCDDAGSLCWGDSVRLDDQGIVANGTIITGSQQDAMMSILPGNALDVGYDELVFWMTSFDYSTTGTYTLIFHLSIAPAR